MSAIPISAMRHAKSEERRQRLRRHRVASKLIRIAAFPTLVAMGVVLERIRRGLERRWAHAEG